MNELDVSVIVTTKNEEEHLGDCLRSVKGQSYPQDKLEIIVVDNNSTDNTKSIASNFTSHIYNLGPERSAQRNFGISNARGKYIIYLDADMVLSEDVISQSVFKCEEEGFKALHIPEAIIGKGFWIATRNFERSFYNETVIDCVRFVQKDTFKLINGFDEDLNGPEDWDFDRRIRAVGKTSIISAVIYHDEGKFNLKRYLSKKRYYARGFDKYIKKWGCNDLIIKKQFGFFYRYLQVFIERDGWRKIMKHPILTLGMFLLRLSVGLVYIYSKIIMNFH